AFWFAPAPPLTLGVCRVLSFGSLLLWQLPHDFSPWGAYSRVFWMPIWLFETTGIQPLPPTAIAWLQTIWKAALLLSAVGLFTRPAMIAAFGIGTYLMGLPHNFGQTQHFDTLVVFASGALALSPAGGARDGGDVDLGGGAVSADAVQPARADAARSRGAWLPRRHPAADGADLRAISCCATCSGCRGTACSTMRRCMPRMLLAALAIAAASFQPPAPAPAPPPDTDIFLAAFSPRAQPAVSAAVNITHAPGYDNQPSFTPDGAAILFTSHRGAAQTDIYRYPVAA